MLNVWEERSSDEALRETWRPREKYTPLKYRGGSSDFRGVRGAQNFSLPKIATTPRSQHLHEHRIPSPVQPRSPAPTRPPPQTATMLYLVGLGLGDETDITLKGLEVVKRSARVYLEAYTSILLVDKTILVR